jgi:hypothetical protein
VPLFLSSISLSQSPKTSTALNTAHISSPVTKKLKMVSATSPTGTADGYEIEVEDTTDEPDRSAAEEAKRAWKNKHSAKKSAAEITEYEEESEEEGEERPPAPEIVQRERFVYGGAGVGRREASGQ